METRACTHTYTLRENRSLERKCGLVFGSSPFAVLIGSALLCLKAAGRGETHRVFLVP